MNLLKVTLLSNACSCLFFGVLFVLVSEDVNHFIGNDLAWLTPWVGIVLIINGCHLLLASIRSQLWCAEILYFIAGDLAWVIASILLIVLGMVITTNQGTIAALLVAVLVGVFAGLQILGIRHYCVNKANG